MGLSKPQETEVRSIVKTAVESLIKDGDFLDALTTKLTEIVVSKLEDKFDSLINKLEDKVCSLEEENNKLRNNLVEIQQYSRRNNLRIFGIPDDTKEDCEAVVTNVITDKLGVRLSKFTSYRYRQLVFTKKRMLKGADIVIKEDLTKERLDLLSKAASQFGIKNTWTQDGVTWAQENNMRRRITSIKDLQKVSGKQ